jgi:deazaflavin-dependent oxidoreductase (nitroreductase family)
MAKKYETTPMIRFFNGLMGMFIRIGLGPPGIYLLTVRGRKTGKLYSTPVSPIERGGERWLVSPYGEMNWVRNARAAGEVMLTRGGKTETLEVQEVGALEVFAAEATKHPVFRLVPKPA